MTAAARADPLAGVWLQRPAPGQIAGFRALVRASLALGEPHFAAWSGMIETAPQRYLRRAARDRDRGRHRFWLVAPQGGLLGVASVGVPAPGWDGNLGYCVAPDARGQGVGRALAAIMAQLAVALGCHVPRATVARGNIASARVLLRAGARRDGEVRFGALVRDVFAIATVRPVLNAAQVAALLAPAGSALARERLELPRTALELDPHEP